MRILIHSAPPWAQSGYGTQCREAAAALAELGHDVAVSAYAGVHEERAWQGIPVLGTGGKAYGNGMIAGNYRRWNADLLITLLDLFVLERGQFRGLTVMPWVMVDTDPLGVLDEQWLTEVAKIAELRPVAASQHGAAMLGQAGFTVPVVPMATRYRPDADAGLRWRHDRKVPQDVFLVAKVGVNNEDDRKAFAVTLQAFADFAKRRPKVGLYMHTEPQAKGAPNLAHAALGLGLKGKVAFADEYLRGCDLYGDSYMESMYNAADVLDASSKGEGFGVPVIEALACGTPVIGARNSAVSEKISPDWGWLIGGQGEIARHHQAWWLTPDAAQLLRAYEKAHAGARRMRRAAAAAGATWTPAAMRAAWAAALVTADGGQFLEPPEDDAGVQMPGPQHQRVDVSLAQRPEP